MQNTICVLHTYSSTIEIVENWNCQTLCSKINKGCVTHFGRVIYIKKKDLKAKEELRKLKYFTMPKYNLQKILKKKPKSFKIL